MCEIHARFSLPASRAPKEFTVFAGFARPFGTGQCRRNVTKLWRSSTYLKSFRRLSPRLGGIHKTSFLSLVPSSCVLCFFRPLYKTHTSDWTRFALRWGGSLMKFSLWQGKTVPPCNDTSRGEIHLRRGICKILPRPSVIFAKLLADFFDFLIITEL